MQIITFKKNIDLHRFNKSIGDVLSKRRVIIPVLFSISGIIIGSYITKGESDLSNTIISIFSKSFMTSEHVSLLTDFFKFLLIPSVLTGVLFFFGLSVFGSVISNVIPFSFGLITGSVSFYFYQNYLLKGLAYCVIIIFPYAVLTIIGMILCSKESACMSELLQFEIVKRKKYIDYSLSMYYKNYLRYYILIVIASVIKAIIDYLFVGLFNF